MYAKVIVDVPVIQVNRPFDYHVPENLQESIEEFEDELEEILEEE